MGTAVVSMTITMLPGPGSSHILKKDLRVNEWMDGGIPEGRH